LRAKDRWLPGAGAEFTRGSNTGKITPGAKGVVANGTVLGGGKAVTAKLEVVVDAAMSGKKALRMAR
jgi:hypothetical protein